MHRRVLGCNRRIIGTTILIVDDHAGFRVQARVLLLAAGYDAVGEAQDGASALAAVPALGPEIFLLDFQPPDATGFEVAQALAEAPEAPAIVLTSSREASDFGHAIHRIGARGVVPEAELSTGPIAAVLNGRR